VGNNKSNEGSRTVHTPDGKTVTETKEFHSGDGGGANHTYVRTDEDGKSSRHDTPLPSDSPFKK
jgi:hypothetical protein